jgi:adenylate cyclase
LEGQTKVYGVGIIIGERTHDLAPDFASLELDLIAVKGKTEAVRIYGLLGSPDFAKSEIFRNLKSVHDRMLLAYRAQEWQEARDLMQNCSEVYPHLAKLYDLYRDRIGQYERNPPGENWDGVFVALTK